MDAPFKTAHTSNSSHFHEIDRINKRTEVRNSHGHHVYKDHTCLQNKKI